MKKETKRLILRTFLVEDITLDYVNSLNDKEVVKYVDVRNKQWNFENVKDFVETSNNKKDLELIGIFLKDTNKHIGNIRLHFNNAYMTVGLAMMIWNKGERHKGYGLESLKTVSDYVLNELGFSKIWGGVYEVNKEAIKMFENAGYTPETTLRSHILYEGEYIDDIIFTKYLEKPKGSPHLNSFNSRKIPSAGPSITDKEVNLVTEAVRHGWYEKRNMHIEPFIEEFKEYIGMEYCLPTSHCTDAIHLAMIALGIGDGDEVIIPDITWVASASPVVYVGGKPIFVDIDKNDWCISPESFKNAITEKTKAVVVVDLLGNMPQMDEIVKIARENNIKIIEDSAEGIGAEYNGKKSGTFGDINVFSFNATKLMIAGQGGMLATNNKEYYDRCKLFLHHGIDQQKEGKYYWSYEVGYNYQWTNIQAALALAQLRRLNELVEIKRKIAKWYKEELKDYEGLSLNYEAPGVKNTFWIVTAIIDKKYGLKKEEIVEKARKYNIDIRPFFYPISSMPPYLKYNDGKEMQKINPVSYDLSSYGICLPSAMSISKKDVQYVCKCLKEILNNNNL